MRDTFEAFQAPKRGRFGDNEHAEPRTKAPRVTGASDLRDVDVYLRNDNPNKLAIAVLFKRDTPFDSWIWLPRSLIEYEIRSGGIVRVDAADNRVSVAATNLDTCSQVDMAAHVTEDGSCLIPADRLHHVLQALADGSHVTINVAAEEKSATLHAGRSNYRFPILSAEQFPDLLTPENAVSVTFSAKEIGRLFKTPASSICEEASRPYLCGIYLHRDDKHVIGAATDAHTLIRVALNKESPEFPHVIVPGAACAEIARMSEGGETVLEISDRLIAAQNGNRRFVSKLIDGTFPPYEKVIPPPKTPALAVTSSDLDSALKRLASVTTKTVGAAHFSWDGEKLVVSVESENGRGEENIDCDCLAEKPAVDVGAQCRYIADAMTALGGKTTRFYFASASHAIRVENPADDNVVAVVMPCRW